MIAIYLIFLLLSFFVLAIITDEFFVESLDIIAQKLKLSNEAAGATLMAVGSSAPELFVALIALFRPEGHGEIGAGTIVGSAIFNILVIVGASALVNEARLHWQVAVRDILFYIFSIILLLVAFLDGQIVLFEAITFLSVYVIYVLGVLKWRDWFNYSDDIFIDEVENKVQKNALTQSVSYALSNIIPKPSVNKDAYIRTFVLSIVGIALLSYVMVESAVHFAEALHINPVIIALTILAAGTSIPDLLSSLIVAKQGRGGMAISNAVGSNIFDILFGLGLPWILAIMFLKEKITVDNENLMSSIFLLFASVIALLFILLTRKWRLGRWAGLILIVIYLGYLGFNILSVI